MEKPRTTLQCHSFHLWLERLAESLNDAGYTQDVLLRALKVKAPVTKDSLKRDIAHGIIQAMFEKDSTAKLTSKEIQELYQVMDQNISEVTGVTVAWPHIEMPLEVYESDLHKGRTKAHRTG